MRQKKLSRSAQPAPGSLNAVLWELDAGNPSVRVTPSDSMESMLVRRFGLKGQALRYVLDLDQEYGRWSGNSFHPRHHIGRAGVRIASERVVDKQNNIS